MNITSAIISGSKILRNKFIPSHQLDSEILMAKTIKKDKNYIILNSDIVLNKNDLNYFFRLIKQRSLGSPVAYLTNKKFFWNSEFFVTNDTLIPRPDTELIIENVLNSTKQKNKINILDIGIGSGCILLSILKEKKNFYGTGVDISNKSLNICKFVHLIVPVILTFSDKILYALPPFILPKVITTGSRGSNFLVIAS